LRRQGAALRARHDRTRWLSQRRAEDCAPYLEWLVFNGPMNTDTCIKRAEDCAPYLEWLAFNGSMNTDTCIKRAEDCAPYLEWLGAVSLAPRFREA
jgi:hypothetical protein